MSFLICIFKKVEIGVNIVLLLDTAPISFKPIGADLHQQTKQFKEVRNKIIK